MVLYLNWDTWEAASQPANDGLPLQPTRQRTCLDITEPAIADEVRRARQMHLPILLVHERAPEHGGCAFDRSSARLECPSWESRGPPPRPPWPTAPASRPPSPLTRSHRAIALAPSAQCAASSTPAQSLVR